MAEIIFASSFDDKYPAQNILINDTSFWVSSGLFPQELYIQLSNDKTINSVNISSYGIKKIMFETCENESAVNYVKQAEMAEVPYKEGKLQEFFLNFTTPKPAKIIKLTVLEGYEDFCSIQNFSFK